MQIKSNEKAAHLLEGQTLEGGWKVLEKYDKNEHQTGGIYSCNYKVVNEDGQIGFLKAFDYSDANKASNARPSELIRNITNSYEYERKVLLKCSDYGLNNVVRYLDSGGIEVPYEIKYPRVEYIILEHADEGDVRSYLKINRTGVAWKLRSLHQITKAISQLHRIQIAHQDVKPSNVLTFNYSNSKLTDMGSAFSNVPLQGELPKYLEEDYCGSYEYSPPELLYGYKLSDWEMRRLACDLYLLGNMIIFYFMDVSINFLLKSNLDRTLWWERPYNYSKYEQIKPYLIEAFEKSLADINDEIKEKDIIEDLENAVRYLCHPDPYQRGHLKNVGSKIGKHGLARFITMFDRMAKKYELKEGIKY